MCCLAVSVVVDVEADFVVAVVVVAFELQPDSQPFLVSDYYLSSTHFTHIQLATGSIRCTNDP